MFSGFFFILHQLDFSALDYLKPAPADLVSRAWKLPAVEFRTLPEKAQIFETQGAGLYSESLTG
jgi:hypothetical protein